MKRYRSFFEIWYVFAYNMFCVSHSMFLFHIACFLLLIICQSEKQFLSTSCWGFHMGLFFPQQPEGLGVLPIKLRGGLGQPPKPCTRFREVPTEWNRFRSEGSVDETLGSERF